jgi:hypothetical protein
MKHGQATGGQNTVAYRVAQRISNNLYKYLPIREHKNEEIKKKFIFKVSLSCELKIAVVDGCISCFSTPFAMPLPPSPSRVPVL